MSPGIRRPHIPIRGWAGPSPGGRPIDSTGRRPWRVGFGGTCGGALSGVLLYGSTDTLKHQYTSAAPPVFDGIDPRSPTPLYEQIASRVRVAVASGQVSAGEALPSVRSLAGELRVNPATVVQAYRELAADGFVEKRHGQGTFIRDLPVMKREEERRRRAIEIARSALAEGARLGLSGEELLDAVADEVRAHEGASTEVPS